MELRRITETYAVAPQIEPGDMAAAAAEGIALVINNRPDHEIPPPLQSGAMHAAAEAAGIAYVEVPADGRNMSMDTVAAHADAIAAAKGPVLAYCASGTRSTILWALSEAGRLDTDEILRAAAAAGYLLDQFRPQIEAVAESRVAKGSD